MKKTFLSFFFLVSAFMLTCSVYAGNVLEPHIFNEGFDSGSVGAWSSYPPSQDTAYDPTIWIKPIEGDVNNKALFREITPNYSIDYTFGVRKKLGMYVDSGSILTFRCYIKSNREIEGVKIRLGFDDGTSEERIFGVTARNVWHSISVPMSDYLSGDTQKKLDAAAFMAVCPNADPENLLRFGIDDVQLDGSVDAQWQFASPPVHKLVERDDFIAGEHFQEGQTLKISGEAPFSSGSVAVIISRALTGEDQKVFRMRRSGGEWQLIVPLSERSGITAGIWRATIRASSKDVKSDFIMSSLVFLVKKSDAPQTNPRLLMSPGDEEKLLEKASSGRMAKIWERINSSAESYRANNDVNNFAYNLDAYDEVYWLPTYDGYIGSIRTPSQYIRSNGIVNGLSDDPEAGEAARMALMKMAEWPSYVHPHILNQGQFTYWPVGQILADMAIGYDMAAPGFDEASRRIAAEALYSKGVTEVYKEYVRDNRVSSNTSNWICDVAGGGILCALAVMDDYEDTDLEPYLTGMILKMNDLVLATFGRDGSYGEGYAYLNHTLHCMNTALPALDRTFGVRFPDKFATIYEALIYQTNPDTKEVYDYGDSSTRFGGMSNFSWIVSKYREPHSKWLYDLSPGTSDVDLFLMDDSVESSDPGDLPEVKLFRDTGTAVFQSGFAGDDFKFIFRCGPFFNHQHFDQGGFFLVDNGERYIGEVGRSNYYDDPWYQKLVVQPGGHSSVIVNDNPESQSAGDIKGDVSAWNDYASITDFIEFSGGAFVSGRLDPLYKGALENLRRSAVYIRPRTVILIDEVIGTAASKTVDLRFHAPLKDDIVASGNDVLIKKPGGTLTIHTVSPEAYSAEVRKRPMTLYEFGQENTVTMKARGFLQLSADIGEGIGKTFVNVMSTDDAVMGGLNDSVASDHVSVTVKNKLLHINTGQGTLYVNGNVTTDALVYTETETELTALRATNLVRDGKTIIESDHTVSLEIRKESDKSDMFIMYSANEDISLRLGVDSKPRQILQDGTRYRDWSYKNGSGVSIKLPKGTGTIEIKQD